MTDINSIVEEVVPPGKVPMKSHGGRDGWFRIACGFTALAALGMAYQALSIARPAADATVFYPPSLAAAFVVGALCVAWAGFLSLRRRTRAGLFLVLGYAIPAVTLYALQRIIVPPSLLLVVSMLALIFATRHRDTTTGLAS